MDTIVIGSDECLICRGQLKNEIVPSQTLSSTFDSAILRLMDISGESFPNDLEEEYKGLNTGEAPSEYFYCRLCVSRIQMIQQVFTQIDFLSQQLTQLRNQAEEDFRRSFQLIGSSLTEPESFVSPIVLKRKKLIRHEIAKKLALIDDFPEPIHAGDFLGEAHFTDELESHSEPCGEFKPIILHTPEVEKLLEAEPEEHEQLISGLSPLDLKQIYNLKELSIVVERLPSSNITSAEETATSSKQHQDLPLAGKKVNQGLSFIQARKKKRTPREDGRIWCQVAGCKNSAFESEYELELHNKKDHEGVKKPFSCSQCDYTGALKHLLKQHVESVHLGIRKYPCPMCDKRFTSPAAVQSHLASKVHLDVKAYTCSQCSKSFKSSWYARVHMETAHSDTNQRRFMCEQCPKGFHLKSNLLEHIRGVHERVKPFVCGTCGAAFSRKGYLIQHIRSAHVKVGGFNCAFCEKSFHTNKRLMNHIGTIHTPDGSKTYSCEICGRRFQVLQYYKRHMRRHAEGFKVKPRSDLKTLAENEPEGNANWSSDQNNSETPESSSSIGFCTEATVKDVSEPASDPLDSAFPVKTSPGLVDSACSVEYVLGICE